VKWAEVEKQPDPMLRHKQPNKNSRFSVAVVSSDAGITYRLARRNFRGKLHFERNPTRYAKTLHPRISV
jgi:hypothetical protein